MPGKRDKPGMIHVGDSRLTAGERHQLRQILFRLQGGKLLQPKVYEKDSLEEELKGGFGELKNRMSDQQSEALEA